MTAALGSGSAPRPSLPQPRHRAPRVILGSAPSRFEATRQPSSGRPKAEDLRPNPLTGTTPRHTTLPQARPNYEIAPDGPLLLHDIGYEGLAWGYPKAG